MQSHQLCLERYNRDRESNEPPLVHPLYDSSIITQRWADYQALVRGMIDGIREGVPRVVTADERFTLPGVMFIKDVVELLMSEVGPVYYFSANFELNMMKLLYQTVVTKNMDKAKLQFDARDFEEGYDLAWKSLSKQFWTRDRLGAFAMNFGGTDSHHSYAPIFVDYHQLWCRFLMKVGVDDFEYGAVTPRIDMAKTEHKLLFRTGSPIPASYTK